MNTPLAAGTAAPDFTLPSTSGETVTLSSFRGKRNVLLAFFPAAFTGTCTSEMCEFSEDYGIYGGHNTEVLPISVDQVPSLRAFQSQEHYDVQVLSDARREVRLAYVVLDDTRYNSRRSYFLIDTEGIIRWVHAETQGGAKRDTAELIRQVEALG
jgi:peroxiredoxin (alkyl hydroperoxide reductase subunit C)